MWVLDGSDGTRQESLQVMKRTPASHHSALPIPELCLMNPDLITDLDFHSLWRQETRDFGEHLIPLPFSRVVVVVVIAVAG